MKIPLEKQLEKAYQIFNKDHAQLRNRLISSIYKPEAEYKQSSGPSLGGRIMTSKAIKIAAGIIIVGIVAVAIRHFTGSKTSTGIAFGQVLRQIQNSSYTFDLTAIFEGKEGVVNNGMVLQPQGILRLDATLMGGVSSLIDLKTGHHLLLFHGQKAAMTEIPGAEKIPEGAGPFSLFTRPVENLWNLRDGTEKPLGEKKIDGQPAVGFEVQQEDPNYLSDIVVWAHAETAIPISVEITISDPKDRSKSIKFLMSKFNIDVELDEKLFSLEPPQGYTLAYQKTLKETVTATESSPQAQKIERSLALWAEGKEDESVQTLLSVDWTQSIEFSDKMYIFSLTEKEYIALKPQDQQQVMDQMLETAKQIRGPAKKLWVLSQTARANKEYQKAELYLETALHLGMLINRNPEGVTFAKTLGFAIRRKSLDEMKMLYTETNQQEKIQQVEKQIQEVDAQKQSFLDGIKSKLGG